MNGPKSIALALLFLSLVFCTQACGQSDTGASDRAGLPVVTHVIEFRTSAGNFEIELYGEDAPLAVANMIGLSDSGFFDGILFHRVHPGFLIQTGDPKTKNPELRDRWGTGGMSIYNGPFPDELNPNTATAKRGYVRGTVAMSNNGPNTNMSQFFILLTDVPGMEYRYTIFGKVGEGMNVVDSIAARPLIDIDKYGGIPKEDVRILSTDWKEVGGKEERKESDESLPPEQAQDSE